jgi:hypothetical protein
VTADSNRLLVTGAAGAIWAVGASMAPAEAGG